MTARVLVLGGYGTFGSFICRKLSETPGLTLIVAGRSLEKAKTFAKTLSEAEAVRIDVSENPAASIVQVRPDIVIHTSGPFQDQNYAVAEAAICAGAHYIDLADGRDFVAGIGALEEDALQKCVTVVSGASSVPCLTSAIVDHYHCRFAVLRELDYAISAAQRTGRGLATTRAILSYTGRPFKTLIDGNLQTVHGWQGLQSHRYRHLGNRFLGYCDVPDLTLLPERYPDLETVRFRAGLEVSMTHLGLWLLSWPVRIGLVSSLAPLAAFLLKASNWFNWLGSDASGFHMTLSGEGMDGRPKSITFELIACSGDGLNIPCIPAILLARRLASGTLNKYGAMPCVGLISLEEYLDELEPLDITWGISEAC